MKELLTPLIQSIKTDIYRIVESQEKVATMRLVDTLDEQSLLEQIIDNSKPIDLYSSRHYLISTPFRYPPLEYGSRFGTTLEPSLFYGAHSINTMLHETAYYSFYFQSGMTTPFSEPIINHKTSFQVTVDETQYLNLVDINDTEFQDKITNKADYNYSQSIGGVMREIGVLAFSYTSARDPNQGLNMGVFDINSIKGDPFCELQWEIKQSVDNIVFYCKNEPTQSLQISINTFFLDGIIPSPSN